MMRLVPLVCTWNVSGLCELTLSILVGCYIGAPSVKLPGKNQRSLWLRKGNRIEAGEFLAPDRNYWGTLHTRKPRRSDSTFKTGVDMEGKDGTATLMLTADPRCALGIINDPSHGPYAKAKAKPNVMFVDGNSEELMLKGSSTVLWLCIRDQREIQS